MWINHSRLVYLQYLQYFVSTIIHLYRPQTRHATQSSQSTCQLRLFIYFYLNNQTQNPLTLRVKLPSVNLVYVYYLQRIFIIGELEVFAR